MEPATQTKKAAPSPVDCRHGAGQAPPSRMDRDSQARQPLQARWKLKPALVTAQRPRLQDKFCQAGLGPQFLQRRCCDCAESVEYGDAAPVFGVQLPLLSHAADAQPSGQRTGQVASRQRDRAEAAGRGWQAVAQGRGAVRRKRERQEHAAGCLASVSAAGAAVGPANRSQGADSAGGAVWTVSGSAGSPDSLCGGVCHAGGALRVPGGRNPRADLARVAASVSEDQRAAVVSSRVEPGHRQLCVVARAPERL